MKVSSIINPVEQYRRYVKQLNQDKADLREYTLIDSHFGINNDRMDQLRQRIQRTEQDITDLLNSDVEELSGINIVG